MIISDKTGCYLREEMRMKKELINKRLGLTIAVVTTVMMFAGCGTQVTTQTSKTGAEAQMVVETVTQEEVNIEKIKAGQEHDINDRCIAADTYDVYNVQVPEETVVSECLSDDYETMTLVSHEVEKADDSFTDRVLIEAIPVNPTKMLMQTINFEAVFVSDDKGDNWSLKETVRNDWTVESPRLPGSTWKLQNGDMSIVKSIFGDDSLSDEGNVYLRLKGNVGYISPNKKETDTSINEANIITNGSGTLIYLDGETRNEIGFKLSDGSINKNGELILTLTSDKGNGQLDFGSELVPMSIKEIDSVFPEEKVSDNVIYFEDLDEFELRSESLDNGTWLKETGSRYGNNSPELSWDAVEGATCYLVLMIDEDDTNHVHWITVTDKTDLSYGEFNSPDNGYTGPYPPRLHHYPLYVLALKNEPADHGILVDSTGKDIHERLNDINGSENNVISYGLLKGNYTWYTIF